MNCEHTNFIISKWKINEFEEIIREFHDNLSEITHHKVNIDDDYSTMLLHIVGKSILVSREVLTLCAHGYSDGAFSLGRNLYEQMVMLLYLNKHEQNDDFQRIINDLVLSYEYKRYKYLKDSCEYLPEIDKSEFDNALETFRKQTSTKISGDYWWANCANFAQLVQSVMQTKKNDKEYMFLGLQYARYKRACIALHAGCLGNVDRIGSDVGWGVIDTSPSVNRQGAPLMFAVVSMIYIIGSIGTHFRMDISKYVNRLNALAKFYQLKERET